MKCAVGLVPKMMRKEMGLRSSVVLCMALFGAVSASAQIVWARQTSGYPNLSHTDGRKPMTSYVDQIGYEITGSWVSAPTGGAAWTMSRINGIGSPLQLGVGFPSDGPWYIDVFSSTNALGNSIIGDLGRATASVIGVPVLFGGTNYFGTILPSYYVEFDTSALSVTWSPGQTRLVSLHHDWGAGFWAWNESNLPSGFASDVVTSSIFVGQVRTWQSFGYPTGVAAIDIGFTPVVPPTRVSGTLTLSDFIGNLTGSPLSVEVWQAGNLVETLNTTLAAGGAFQLSPTPNGTCTLKFRTRSGLKRAHTLTLGPSPVTGVVIIETNGDVDHSGEVDAADIDEVIAHFGTVGPDPADVDGSDEVDAADIDIVIANFGSVDD